MKSNQLIRIPRKRAVKPVTSNRLEEIEKTLDKMWSMFQTQVERNMELMSMIQKQHENSHNLTFSLPQIEPAPVPAQKETPAETKDVPELGYEKLIRFELLFDSVVNIRKDALHSIINVFHYLYHYGCEAYPEQLISISGISEATFYRHMQRIREAHLIIFKRGKAVITEAGKKLYTEEIKTVIDLKKAIHKEKFHCEAPDGLYENPSQYDPLSALKHNQGN